MKIEVDGAAPLAAGDCKVIAEAGANHNNSVERAIQMAEQAAQAGAWAIKFQLYKAGTIAVRKSPKYWEDAFGTSTQYDAFKLSDKLDYQQYEDIAQACQDLGILYFATPFDAAAVEALERNDVSLYKIASADLTNKPLLQLVAQTRKPILLSTGAATEDEVLSALEWLSLPPELVCPLACTLTYPTPDQDGNFARIEGLRALLPDHLVGMSDHTLGTDGGLVAGALGAVVIEKHYTIDKKLPDVPDHAMSVNAEELAELVRVAHRGALLRGSSVLSPVASEMPARESARRSLVLHEALAAGTVVREEHLTWKRPGTGVSPGAIDQVVGRSLARDVDGDVPLVWEDLQ